MELRCNRTPSCLLADLADKTSPVNYYTLLGIDQNATQVDIKAAYHKVLLSHHPDKRKKDASNVTTPETFDFALLKEAYRTLIASDLRELYDAGLSVVNAQQASGPRPAQIISLDDFEYDEAHNTWSHICRCGGNYRVDEQFMEEDHHLINCDSCSEVIWVGYEVVEDS